MSFLPAVREMFRPAPTDDALPTLPPKRVMVDATIDVTVSFKTPPRAANWRDPTITWRMTVPRDRAQRLVDALDASWRITDVRVE